MEDKNIRVPKRIRRADHSQSPSPEDATLEAPNTAAAGSHIDPLLHPGICLKFLDASGTLF